MNFSPVRRRITWGSDGGNLVPRVLSLSPWERGCHARSFAGITWTCKWVSRILNNRSVFLRKRKHFIKITKKQRNKTDSNVRLVWIRCLLQRYFLCRACRGRRTCRAIYRCRTGLTGWRRCFKPVHRSRCTWRSVYKLFRLCLLLFFRCLSKESHAVFHGTHPTSALTKFRALGIKSRSARLKCVSFKSKYC